MTPTLFCPLHTLTLNSTNHSRMSSDVNVVRVRKQLYAFFEKIMPLGCTPACRKKLSMTNLRRSYDKGSPCLKPLMVSKGSMRSIHALLELRKMLNVIMHSLISSYIAAKTWYLMGLPKADLQSTRRWHVLTCFSRAFFRIWNSFGPYQISVLTSGFRGSHNTP